MSRSIWKGFYVNRYIGSEKFFKRRKKTIWARNSIVPSTLVGKTVYIHTGKTFVKVLITREKVGFKFGEFAPTRKFTQKYEKRKNESIRKKNK